MLVSAPSVSRERIGEIFVTFEEDHMIHRTTLAILFAFGMLFGGCDVEQTEEGQAPEVQVEPGDAPEYDVETGEVEVGTETEEVEVPTVDIEGPEDQPAER